MGLRQVLQMRRKFLKARNRNADFGHKIFYRIVSIERDSDSLMHEPLFIDNGHFKLRNISDWIHFMNL